MNVAHVFEQVEGESDVDGGAVDKLFECIIVELLDEVADKDVVLVQLPVVSLLKVVHLDVKELVGFLAGAVGQLALSHVAVDDSDDRHALLLILVSTATEVLKLVHMEESVNVGRQFVNGFLEQALKTCVS